MNRLSSVNLRDVRPELLPPVQREGPARILFLSLPILGWATQIDMIRRYSAGRPDIDAVYIDLKPSPLMKLLGKSLPLRGWCFHNFRYLAMYRYLLRRWLRAGRGPLDIRRFDVVCWITQIIGWPIVDFAGGPARMAVNIDSTGILDCRFFGKAPGSNVPFIAVERKMFKSADLILSLSRWAADSARDDYKIPEERLLVAPGAVPIPPIAAAHRPLGPDKPRVRMIFIGNAWERKGGPALLEMHQQRFADRVDLHIVSSGAPILPSARNVTWHGSVPREQLLGHILPEMDLFVLPTREDTMLWVAIEASAAGLPVITTRMAGMEEVVLDERSGLLCPRNDLNALSQAIERLISDRDLRITMGERGREHVTENFNSDLVYPNLLDRLVALADQPECGRGQRSALTRS